MTDVDGLELADSGEVRWATAAELDGLALDPGFAKGWEIGAVFAVEKPGHLDGKKTLSFQFLDQSGHSAFKVFLGFGGSVSPEKAERYVQVRDAFRKK